MNAHLDWERVFLGIRSYYFRTPCDYFGGHCFKKKNNIYFYIYLSHSLDDGVYDLLLCTWLCYAVNETFVAEVVFEGKEKRPTSRGCGLAVQFAACWRHVAWLTLVRGCHVLHVVLLDNVFHWTKVV